MGEIGSGDGTGFPAALDTGATAEVAIDYVRLAWGTDVEAAIVAIEAELGIDPAGPSATVVARLNMMSNATGGGVARGLASARPAASAGVLFYSSDTEILEVSTGAGWRPVLLGGG